MGDLHDDASEVTEAPILSAIHLRREIDLAKPAAGGKIPANQRRKMKFQIRPYDCSRAVESCTQRDEEHLPIPYMGGEAHCRKTGSFA